MWTTRSSNRSRVPGKGVGAGAPLVDSLALTSERANARGDRNPSAVELRIVPENTVLIERDATGGRQVRCDLRARGHLVV